LSTAAAAAAAAASVDDPGRFAALFAAAAAASATVMPPGVGGVKTGVGLTLAGDVAPPPSPVPPPPRTGGVPALGKGKPAVGLTFALVVMPCGSGLTLLAPLRLPCELVLRLDTLEFLRLARPRREVGSSSSKGKAGPELEGGGGGGAGPYDAARRDPAALSALTSSGTRMGFET